MIIQIQHTTRYDYDGPVSFSDHQLRVCPRSDHALRWIDFSVITHPKSSQRWVRDVYNNPVWVCNFGLQESRELVFEVSLKVEIERENPFNFILDPHALSYPLKYQAIEREALKPYIDHAVGGAGSVLDWFYEAVPSPVTHDEILIFISDLNQALRRDIRYVRREEEGVQSPDETLNLRAGSCRDMAWLMIAICRQLGLAARFVSGYLHVPVPEEGDGGVQAPVNRAAGSMHAWVEIYLPGAGWKGFDPTNGILADSLFIPCAVSLDPIGAAPTVGRYFAKTPTQSKMDFTLSITVDESTAGDTPGV
jgi:transglutaminase-like putative cysteine protease